MENGRGWAKAVARACRIIVDEGERMDLERVSAAVGMSPSHFHRIFKAMTGVTPKAYATGRRWQRAREELRRGSEVTAAIYKAGFGSNGRFYTGSAGALGMRPATFAAGGQGERIRFAVGECSLGSILVAASQAGICCISLGDDPQKLVEELQECFAKAQLVGGDGEFESWVAKVVALVEDPAAGLDLPLDVRGTAFQLRVWEKLREIPCGQRVSYSELAVRLGEQKSTRAVATACAANRIAVAIPCHRVVRRDGGLSGYRWGVKRKAKLLKKELRKPDMRNSKSEATTKFE